MICLAEQNECMKNYSLWTFTTHTCHRYNLTPPNSIFYTRFIVFGKIGSKHPHSSANLMHSLADS